MVNRGDGGLEDGKTESLPIDKGYKFLGSIED